MSDDAATTGILFLHLMKTGGTAATRSLRTRYVADMYPRTGNELAEKTFPDQLLDITPAVERSFQLISVHMAADVIDHITPGRLTCTVLREPVSRTVSHLRQIADKLGTSVDEVYDRPVYRDRLRNYQCRVLGGHIQRAPTDVVDPATLDDDARHALFADLQAVWSTAIHDRSEPDDRTLHRALDRLASLDVVGTSTNVAAFIERVGSRVGTEFPVPTRDNVTTTRTELSDSLLDRIRADCSLDHVVYERALELERRD